MTIFDNISLFCLFIYDKYLDEDFDDLNIIGKICIMPFWFILMFYKCIFIIGLLPLFYLRYYFNDVFELFKQEIKIIEAEIEQKIINWNSGIF